MIAVPAVRFSIVAALLLATACQSSGGSSSAMPIATKPTSTAPQSCERGCNSEYDGCMDRFTGTSGGPGFGQHQDDANAVLGPNDICPDQLKYCLRRCMTAGG